jgi:cohesin loading factor subunit SCC2
MCLGSLFRAYPILILREEAMKWMDGVFASTDTATQARLLDVIHEFLLSEAEKKAGGGTGMTIKAKAMGNRDMDALIGNAPELSESGSVARATRVFHARPADQLDCRLPSCRETSPTFCRGQDLNIRQLSLRP